MFALNEGEFSVSLNQNRNDLLVHLQMIQDVISRMVRCSFLLKQWSIVVFAAILTFSLTLQSNEFRNCLLPFLLPAPFVAFWLMDAFYLKQERDYRWLFNQMRKQEETDFNMSASSSSERYWSSFFSVSILWFYLAESGFLFVVILLKHKIGR